MSSKSMYTSPPFSTSEVFIKPTSSGSSFITSSGVDIDSYGAVGTLSISEDVVMKSDFDVMLARVSELEEKLAGFELKIEVLSNQYNELNEKIGVKDDLILLLKKIKGLK